MNKFRRLRWAAYVDRMEEGWSALKILIGKYTGKTPLRRRKRKLEDNVGIDPK